jgi:hypothetical protein
MQRFGHVLSRVRDRLCAQSQLHSGHSGSCRGANVREYGRLVNSFEPAVRTKRARLGPKWGTDGLQHFRTTAGCLRRCAPARRRFTLTTSKGMVAIHLCIF